MKKFIFFARVYTWLLVIFPIAGTAQNLEEYPNYVVIGAFEHKKNAVFFTDDANHHNFPARFEMNPNRNLYYVYVLTTEDREHAFAEALKLRTDTKYFDTWVYSGLLGSASLPNAKSQDFDINPTTGEQIVSVGPDQGRTDDHALGNNGRNSQVDGNGSENKNHASGSSERAGSQQTRTGGATKVNQTPVSGSTEGSQNPALQTNGQEQEASNVDSNDSGNKNISAKSPQLSDRASAQQPGTARSTKENQTDLSGSTRDSQNGALQTNGQKRGASQVDAIDAENKYLTSASPESLQKAGTQQTRTGGAAKEDQTQVSGSTLDSRNRALQTSGQKQDGSRINGDQTTSPDQSGVANNSGLTNGEKQKQVTITRADGTSVVARTTDAPANDKNAATRLAPDPSDQTQDTNTSAQNRVDADPSDNPSGKVGSEKKKNAIAKGDDRSPLNADKKENAAVTGPPPIKVSTQPLSAEEVVGKNFYFYLFRADNHDMVGGEVDAIDFERSRRMATYPANSQVKVIMPSGKSKQISFVCQVFGYRKLQKEFKPGSPDEEMYLDEKGNVVVPFELMRLQKGDIAIMYNVFFFKDAAVMRPESRFEVNNLLELLQENPSYKIRIHGHTNGNAPGKIIYMDQPGNFYSLSNTRNGGGSAKKLSEERALVIREYLISSGISADRMQVEAWGGKKPIHDKNSARAHENVRVEIEILSD